MIKSTILIDGKYLFNYTAQSNYCILEIFNCAFLKNNIETKDDCNFDKTDKKRNNFWEIHQACKCVHQIPTIANKLKIRLLIKEDLGCYGRAKFVGKLFDSTHRIPL